MARTSDVTTVVGSDGPIVTSRSTLRRVVTPDSRRLAHGEPPSRRCGALLRRPAGASGARTRRVPESRMTTASGRSSRPPTRSSTRCSHSVASGLRTVSSTSGAGTAGSSSPQPSGSGCRSIGVERSSSLAALARVRAADDGVTERVEIREADGRTVDLDGATVVFMFLPIDVVGDLLGPTLRQLPKGARLIVHEQSRLPAAIQPAPDSSMAVIADDAVTVAHCGSSPDPGQTSTSSRAGGSPTSLGAGSRTGRSRFQWRSIAQIDVATAYPAAMRSADLGQRRTGSTRSLTTRVVVEDPLGGPRHRDHGKPHRTHVHHRQVQPASAAG